MAPVIIGSDHAGFELKQEMIAHLQQRGIKVQDMGCDSTESVDYPDFAKRVAREVANATDGTKGILICGTGIGMSIAANKFKGVRAALCLKEYDAQMARNHNDANIVCLGARTIQKEVAFRVVNTFLKSEFEGGRHARRVAKISSFE